jgi:hypothetical protein
MNGISCMYLAQPSTNKTRIYANNITVHQPNNLVGGGVAIDFVHPAAPSPYRARVYDNIITINNGYVGVQFNNISNARIRHNTITHNTTFPITTANGRKGILLMSCNTDTVDCNPISSNALFNNTLHDGINIAVGTGAASNNLIVEGNTLNRTFNGIAFRGAGITGLRAIANTVQDAQFGWYIGNNINVQGNLATDFGNTWAVPFPSGGAGSKAVRSLPNTLQLYSNKTPTWINTWVQLSSAMASTNSTPTTLGFDCSQPMLLPPNPDEWTVDYAHQIVLDELIFEEYEAENRWALKEELYRRMASDSLLFVEDSLLLAFRNTMALEDVGRVYEIENREQQREELPSALASAMESIEGQILTLTDIVNTNLALMDTTTNDTLKAIYLAQIYTQKLQLEVLNNTYSELQSQADNIDSLSIAAILYHNQGLDAEATYTANLQAVNDIFYTTLALDANEVSEAELSTLWEIAAQCPTAGGAAVFQARAILTMLNYFPDFNDEATCALIQSPWRQENSSQEISDIRLYPNPSDGIVYLTYPAIMQGQTWTLYNIWGSKIKDGALNHRANALKKSRI